jgi:ribosomal protein S18 acetylase RimI-like enzyme
VDPATGTIATAEKNQGALLGDILGDAFTNDLCFNWVIPDRRLYPRFFRLLADRLYLPQQHCYLDKEGRGAAMWLPPGTSSALPLSAAQLLLVARLVLHSGVGILKNLQQAQEVMDRHHPREPHYYLHAIGARLASQGQGVGSALLKVGTRICDREQMPAYLESSSERNTALYQRHGFEVVAEEPIGKGGPPLYFMWRAPLAGEQTG